MKKYVLALITALLLIFTMAISGCSAGITNSGGSGSTSRVNTSTTSKADSQGTVTPPTTDSDSKDSTTSNTSSSDEGTTEGPSPSLGTLTIADVDVEYGKTATITPVFSSLAEEIKYAFEGSDISISGNTVTGNTAEAIVTVRATTVNYSTTFTVRVGKNYNFSIADVSVDYGKTATVSPVFEVAANAETINYSFSGNDISITDNVVTGNTAQASVSVTATTAHYSTTFTVNVGKNYKFSIADVSVDYGKTATISPVFEVAANAETINYTFSGSDISVSGNTVTGNASNAVVTVTATSAHHSTTFTVRVGQNWGTLTISNVNVPYNGTATISPSFSTVSETITYSYDSNKITISGNTVTGRTAGAVVTVTATTAHLSTTFTVTVGANYGTLSIANITTYKDFYAVAKPVFSTITENITYEFDSSKLSVSGNKFTGLQIGTHTVTARTAHVSTTFTVTVNDNSGSNALNSGFLNSLNSRINGYNSYNHDSGNLAMFIGDSFFDTQFFSDFYTRFAEYNAYTFGISATQTRQWEWYVQKLYGFNPRTIVIHIGTNDIFDDGKGKDEVVARLKRLFTNLHENLPNTRVYWFSIEPRIGSGDANGNAIAVQVNSAIQSYLSNGYATYMDSYSVFNAHKDSTYYRDSVHPTVPLGYDKLMEVLANSGHTFTANSKFDGTITNWTTTTSDTFTTSKNMYFASGQFLYTSTITINSTNANGHITLNLNNSGDSRFLLWNNNNNSGKFYYGGVPGYTVCSNYTTTGQTINVAVLKAQKHAYMFIDGVLQVIYYNAPAVNSLTVGSEACSVTFANNKVYNSTTSQYSAYLAKEGVSTYQNSSETASKIVFHSSGVNGVACDDFTTIQGTDTFWSSKSINGASGKFILGFDFTINSTDKNGHITINFNNDGGTRFLIWNHNNDGKFHFNGLNGGQYNSAQQAIVGAPYHADILVNDNYAYMFINGTLQTVYYGKPTVNSLTLGSEACAVAFKSITVYSTASDVYKTKADLVTSYESQTSSSTFYDVGTDLPLIGHSSWTTTTNDNFGTSKAIAGASGRFLVTFKANVTSAGENAHLTFNLNGGGSDRFLLWDSLGKGYFYYCGFYGGTFINTSKNYATVGTEVEISILVANKNAYMFINGVLQTVYYNVPAVNSMTIGSENCATSFSDVVIYKEGTSTYNSKKSSVNSYENSSETASKVVDVGT